MGGLVDRQLIIIHGRKHRRKERTPQINYKSFISYASNIEITGIEYLQHEKAAHGYRPLIVA